MKAKTILSIALLLFVGVSVAYLVITETGGIPAPGAPPSETTAPHSADPGASDSQEASMEQIVAAVAPSESATATAKVVAYYFHGNVRCVTCGAIESRSKEAIETGFADALRDGDLEWRTVNVQDSGNGHFVRDFELVTSSIVLERLADGKRQEWKNLEHVWTLVGRDKAVFSEYIQNETKAYLEAADQ